MNNLFYNALAGAQGQTYPFRNNVAYSRSGEPISVNGIESVNQTQYILGQMGRWVAWAGTGAPATVATGT